MGLIWGSVIAILGLFGTIVIAVMGRVLGDDFKEWLPWITRRFVYRAVSRLPKGERERYEQEWWAHINELPGNLAKIYVAWGLLSASKSINEIALYGDTTNPLKRRVEEATRRCIEILIAATILFCTMPLVLIIAILIKLESGGPVFSKHKSLGANSRTFDLLKFRSIHVSQITPAVGHSWCNANW